MTKTKDDAEDVKATDGPSTAERKERAAETKESNTRRQEITDDERAADQPRFVERTPRDVAINKAKAGEDTGLESSRPDKTERFRVPGRFVSRGQFEDFDGRTWSVSKTKESQAARIDPEAVRKDGGDPHLLGVASADARQLGEGEIPEKAVVPTHTGNAQPSEDPVEAPKDRARIAKTDGPSTRPRSKAARDAEAEAKAAPVATEGGKSAKAKAGAPSRFARAKRTLLKK